MRRFVDTWPAVLTPGRVMAVAVGWLVFAWALLLLVDAWDVFGTRVATDWPIWFRMFNVSWTEWFQWAFLGVLVVGSAATAVRLVAAGDRRAGAFWWVFGIGIALLLLEDAGNVRHHLTRQLAGEWELLGVSSFDIVGTSVLAAFAAVPVAAVLRFRRSAWSAPGARRWLVAGLATYGAIGLAHPTRSLFLAYASVGRWLHDLITRGEMGRPPGFEPAFLHEMLIDGPVEESVELIGAACLLAALLAWRRDLATGRRVPVAGERSPGRWLEATWPRAGWVGPVRRISVLWLVGTWVAFLVVDAWGLAGTRDTLEQPIAAFLFTERWTAWFAWVALLAAVVGSGWIAGRVRDEGRRAVAVGWCVLAMWCVAAFVERAGLLRRVLGVHVDGGPPPRFVFGSVRWYSVTDVLVVAVLVALAVLALRRLGAERRSQPRAYRALTLGVATMTLTTVLDVSRDITDRVPRAAFRVSELISVGGMSGSEDLSDVLFGHMFLAGPILTTLTLVGAVAVLTGVLLAAGSPRPDGDDPRPDPSPDHASVGDSGLSPTDAW